MIIDSERIGLDKKFYELCNEVVMKNDLLLYDLVYIPGQKTLRLFVIDENKDTADLNDCVKIDRALTEHIENLEWIPDSLVLEVSSPGIFRGLTTVDHFNSARGKDVNLQLNKKLKDLINVEFNKKMKESRKVTAMLVEVYDGEIEVNLDNQIFKIKYENIKKANLETKI